MPPNWTPLSAQVAQVFQEHKWYDEDGNNDADNDDGDADNHADNDADYDDNDLYMIGRFCLSVTKNHHFAQQSQIKFFSGNNFFFLNIVTRKCSLWIAHANNFFKLLIF